MLNSALSCPSTLTWFKVQYLQKKHYKTKYNKMQQIIYYYFQIPYILALCENY